MVLEVITSATVSGLLIWFTKSWISERLKNVIKNEYDQKLETHKAELKAKTDVEIVKLRAQLNIMAKEHEVRFSKLHEKRAEVITATYALLKQLFLALRKHVIKYQPNKDDDIKERRELVFRAYQQFHDYYIIKVIFFPKNVARKLDTIDSKLLINYNKFVTTVEMNKRSEMIDSWINTVLSLENEINSALNELEDEFRRILGDEGEINDNNEETTSIANPNIAN
jgi:viroplasmin and RNaseH domain-containing protein